MIAFITIRNNPKLTMVIGIVNKTIIGFTMAFKNESTAATITAIRGVSTLTPFRKYELTITASAETNSFSINFI